jgi:hypothetical protein
LTPGGAICTIALDKIGSKSKKADKIQYLRSIRIAYA